MCHPKRRKRRVTRRGRRRKNTKRRVGGIRTAVGPTPTPFSRVTSKGPKRQMGMDMYNVLLHHTLNFIHTSALLLLLLCIYGCCVWLCVHPCRPKAAPLPSCFSWLDDVQSPTEQPFCVDRKADPANWTYKSLYRGDVAR